ncbi:MAG TPA: hypothetical protein VLB02_01185 [Candidatus Paceibacterota bacterium]|nr:hypothetical protein [Candidatus Paceibacterota bacterium]
MKRTIITSAVALSLLLGTAAFAQNTATTPPMPPAPSVNKARLGELKDEMQAKREALKTDMQERRTDLKEDAEAAKKALQEKRAALAEELKAKRAALQAELKTKREALKAEIAKVKKERVIVRKGYVEQKLRQVLVVLTEKQARIQKAIDALKAKGNDVTEAQKHLDESKAALKTATEKLDALVKLVINENEPKPLEAARALAKEAEAALKSTREHLVLAIQELKLLTSDDEDDSDDDTNETTSTTGTTTNTQN